MALEIEAKLKIGSPGEVQRVLTALDAKLTGTVTQTDHYLDDDAGSLKASDRALRVRCQQGDDGIEETIVTFKGAKMAGRVKVRDEFECKAESLESICAVLSALGYKERFIMQKRRQLWRIGECWVCIDQLPLLGWFIEIEGPTEQKVDLVQQELGLGGLEHISQSYACLLEERMEETGISKKEILLESSGL